jgi:2-hydroxychromene-2-carboxylate isomerase
VEPIADLAVSPDMMQAKSAPGVVEVFADIGCPFTHVGLRRFVAERTRRGREDVMLWVRAWPLELVNGVAMDPDFIAEEIGELRAQLAGDLFGGFRPDRFPTSTEPALRLAAQGYAVDVHTGEAVSLALRHELFEKGEDVADPKVLERVAAQFGLADGSSAATLVLADHAEGQRRGVVGSPHFFTARGDYFCPALDITRDEGGHLHISLDSEGYAEFLESCFG